MCLRRTASEQVVRKVVPSAARSPSVLGHHHHAVLDAHAGCRPRAQHHVARRHLDESNGRLTLGSRVLLHRAERYGLRAVVQRWRGKVASGGAHVDLAADASGKDLPEEERDLRLRRHLCDPSTHKPVQVEQVHGDGHNRAHGHHVREHLRVLVCRQAHDVQRSPIAAAGGVARRGVQVRLLSDALDQQQLRHQLRVEVMLLVVVVSKLVAQDN
mmetsp:Transcript_21551/g.54272  ORF Transcript_21551/g.54272 Transcript_21551/m.54272 type:complete len:214 (+) Transcript_21551:91-732(+)